MKSRLIGLLVIAVFLIAGYTFIIILYDWKLAVCIHLVIMANNLRLTQKLNE